MTTKAKAPTMGPADWWCDLEKMQLWQGNQLIAHIKADVTLSDTIELLAKFGLKLIAERIQ